MTTNTNTTTLASRAAGLLSKGAALAVAEKAISQAVAAKRVFPPMAQDFAEQLGVELPLKTKDFVRVVGNLLTATEKPLKGVISKKKYSILAVLADLVAALTDTPAVSLPAWALPKTKAVKTAEESAAEESAAADGALDKANVLAKAEANAAKAEAEASADKAIADAIALIVSRAAELTEEQRIILASVLVSAEAEASEAEAEAEESTEA